MKAILTGKRQVEYTSKKTGQPVKGISLYYTSPLFSDDSEGVGAYDTFVSNGDYKAFKVGQSYDFDFDRNGRLQNVSPA